MRKLCFKILTIYVLSICVAPSLVAQNIKITDTVKTNSDITSIKSDSSFTVEGEVAGLDSGTIKIFLSTT